MAAPNPTGVVGPRGGTTFTPPPTPPPPGVGGGGGPSKRNLYIVAGVAVVTIAFILWRKKQSASAASTTSASTTTDTSGATAAPLPGSGVLQPIIIGQGGGSTGSDTDTDTTTPVQTTGSTTTQKAPPVAEAKQIGSGYNTPVTGYSYIPTPADLSAVEAAGGQLFYEPAPGVEARITGPGGISKGLAGLKPGTPIFTKSGLA